MTQKDAIRLLAEQIVDKKINTEDAKKILSHLSRRNLRILASEIKKQLVKERIYVSISGDVSGNTIKSIQEIFPGKDIITAEDPSLLEGIKIQNGDDVYDLSLKNRIETVVKKIESTL